MNREDLVPHVLCALAAETNAKSSMGAQLDQLATRSEARKERHGWGTHSSPTRSGAAKDYEGAVLADAETFAVIRGLESVEGTVLELAALPVLAETLGKPLGATCVRVLRVYQSALRAPSDESVAREKGHANASARLTKARERFGVSALEKTFGLTAYVAAETYADALLMLDAFVKHTKTRRTKKAAS